MSYIDNTREEIEDRLARYGLDDDMFFSLFDEAKEQQELAGDGFYVHQKVFSYLLEKGYVENIIEGDGWKSVADNIINAIKNIENRLK